jgi:vancomycin permeability regulator SanA
MRRLLKLVFKLFAFAVVIFLLTAAWIILDGLIDFGAKADVALLTSQGNSPLGASEARLDRVIKLYNDGEFPFIVVSGSARSLTYDEPAAMARYLEDHGIPASAIIKDNHGETMQQTAHDMAEIMKAHKFHSVMLVTEYYDMTRMKLMLNHEGITDISKAHVGNLQKQDAMKIGRAVVSLYQYIGITYVLPTAKKFMGESQTAFAKAKETVTKKLDSLSK